MEHIRYTKEAHIITQQKQSEEAILAEFAAGDWTLAKTTTLRILSGSCK